MAATLPCPWPEVSCSAVVTGGRDCYCRTETSAVHRPPGLVDIDHAMGEVFPAFRPSNLKASVPAPA